jgi:hypothetical protein
MKEIATINFRDVETMNEAIAIVRSGENAIAICLSVRGEGDLEVVLSKIDARTILEAFRQALV